MLSDLPYLLEMTKLNDFSGLFESVTCRKIREETSYDPNYILNAGLGCTPFFRLHYNLQSLLISPLFLFIIIYK
jgi:hypothetical protein